MRIAVKVPLGGKRGMVLLSTDVNATGATGLGARITAWLRTWWQRWRKERLADAAIRQQLTKAGVAVGWSIGGTLLGRDHGPVKQLLYIERSFWVEMLHAPYPLLNVIAEALRQAFHQEEVILKRYDTGVAEHIRDPQAIGSLDANP
jgi:hypothetical protein